MIAIAAKPKARCLATSTFTLAEVCKSPDVKATEPSKLAEYFEVDYILLVNLDRGVAELARTIMGRGYSKLKPPDACHLASAAIANADELHTFDDKLLALDGLIEKANKTRLRICRPDAGGQPAPLLEAMRPELVVESPKVSPPKGREVDLDPTPIEITPPKFSFPSLDFDDNPNVTTDKKPTLKIEGPPIESRSTDPKAEPSK